MLDNNDLFKKLKGIFVVSDDNTESSLGGNMNADSKAPTRVSNPMTSIADSASINEKHLQLLMAAIEQNNLEGFDYLEYRNSLLSLTNVIADESMRYKSAFEMAKTMGLDKKKLLDSAGFYINILNGEQKKFLDALENQKAKQIQARVDNIANLEKSVAEKKKMIEQLTQDMEIMSKQMTEIKQEINEEVQKIETTNKQFVASYQYLAGQINSDVDKINKNL